MQRQTKLVQDENQLLENILRTLLQELVVRFFHSYFLRKLYVLAF